MTKNTENSRIPNSEPLNCMVERPLTHYQFISLLGKGAMGTVYLAYDPLIHRTIAIKILNGKSIDNEGKLAVARFLMEVMLNGRLTHAGIIPIYEVGFDSRHGYYYTMRYVKGRNLHEILRKRKDAIWGNEREHSLTRLIGAFYRVCEAIAHAHQNGILHRDLKPANVMITDSNEVLVVDWGVAKDLGTYDPLTGVKDLTKADTYEQCLARRGEALQKFLNIIDPNEIDPEGLAQLSSPSVDESPLFHQLTQDGASVGTPAYMSPEQISAENALTPASDVYSLGVILYQILSGSLPVNANNVKDMLHGVLNGNIVPIESRPEAFRLSKVLCDIVSRCLRLNPSERYANAGELATVIQLFQEGATPYRLLAKENFIESFQGKNASISKELWNIDGGVGELTAQGLLLSEGAYLSSQRNSLGDFKCTLLFHAMTGPWCMSVSIGNRQNDSVIFSHHEIRIGVEERAFLELLGMRGRIRRFDLRMQSAQNYLIEITFEEEYTRVRLDGVQLLNYREIFPQTGGTITIHARRGNLFLHDFEWLSCGAPLQLSYQFLPDKHFQLKQFEQARLLYLQLAESHPDREEGLMALYKAGLCSAELNETQAAFELFSKLENTMLDHYCALGLARIGMLQFNLDWSWEALKSAYIRHKHPEVRSDMWFGLLNILELMGDVPEQKIKKYLELINEFDPSPQEMNQITYEYLDLVRQRFGLMTMRKEAVGFLRHYSSNPLLMSEALLALWHSGIDEEIESIAQMALDKVLENGINDPNYIRYLLMKAELLIAQLRFVDAMQYIEKVIEVVDRNRSESIWARNWAILCLYLQGDFRQAISRGSRELETASSGRTDQQVYLLLIVGISLVRSGNREKGQIAITQASHCSGWWGQIALTILEHRPPESMPFQHQSPNLVAETLWLAGETHFCFGNYDLANSFFIRCEHHSSRRLMTRRLARERLNNANADSPSQMNE